MFNIFRIASAVVTALAFRCAFYWARLQKDHDFVGNSNSESQTLKSNENEGAEAVAATLVLKKQTKSNFLSFMTKMMSQDFEPMFKTESLPKLTLLLGIIVFSSTAQAQFALDQCPASRFGGSLNCTANEAELLSMTATNPPPSCIVGQPITLDLTAAFRFNTSRYNQGFFVGLTGGTNMNLVPAAGGPAQCKSYVYSPFGTLPNYPPLGNSNGDACGDSVASGTATGIPLGTVTVTCNPDPVTGFLQVPWLATWSQSNYVCTGPESPVPGTTSKCNSGLAPINVSVLGKIRITKQTLPDGNTTPFNFKVSSTTGASISSGTPNAATTSFSASDNQTIELLVPLTAAGTNVTVEELPQSIADLTGLTCTKPDGSLATFITTNVGTRTLSATMNFVNNEAACTFTNKLKPVLTVTKTASQSPLVVGQTGQFYTITIAVANGPTTAAITLADALPTGITTSGVITATGGSLSGCPAAGASNLTGCSISAGAAGPIVLTVPVSIGAATATPSFNLATVTGGGDPLCTGTATACTGTVSTPVISTASVAISKTDDKTIATSGGKNAYMVTLTNQGPSPANGVVLTDTPSAGLTCPPTNPVVCSVIAGPVLAQCPTGTLTLGNLISPGYTIANFPANSGLQFTYTCNVN